MIKGITYQKAILILNVSIKESLKRQINPKLWQNSGEAAKVGFYPTLLVIYKSSKGNIEKTQHI